MGSTPPAEEERCAGVTSREKSPSSTCTGKAQQPTCRGRMRVRFTPTCRGGCERVRGCCRGRGGEAPGKAHRSTCGGRVGVRVRVRVRGVIYCNDYTTNILFTTPTLTTPVIVLTSGRTTAYAACSASGCLSQKIAQRAGASMAEQRQTTGPRRPAKSLGGSRVIYSVHGCIPADERIVMMISDLGGSRVVYSVHGCIRRMR